MASPTRRKLIKAAALAPAGAWVPLTLVRGMPSARAASRDQASPAAPAYLTASERAFVDAAVARILPSDDLGPGAREAGVTAFIDRQLAGEYGRAESWYMQGPWRHGTEQQGYQLPLTPAQLYRDAIAAIDEHARRRDGKSFAELAADEQDRLLDALDKDQLHLGDVPVHPFFEMLVQNTVEGFLSDPIYGGNLDFVGWKLIGFPGPRYNYMDEIDRYGRRYDLPVVSIGGRDSGVRRG